MNTCPGHVSGSGDGLGCAPAAFLGAPIGLSCKETASACMAVLPLLFCIAAHGHSEFRGRSWADSHAGNSGRYSSPLGRGPFCEHIRWAVFPLFSLARCDQGQGWPSADLRMLDRFHASMGRQGSQLRSSWVRDQASCAMIAGFGSGPSALHDLSAFRLEHSKHVVAAVDANDLAGRGRAVVRAEVDRGPSYGFKRCVCP